MAEDLKQKSSPSKCPATELAKKISGDENEYILDDDEDLVSAKDDDIVSAKDENENEVMSDHTDEAPNDANLPNGSSNDPSALDYEYNPGPTP